MRCDFGDVVLVPFPFTDQSGLKKRPAVVASSPAYNRQRPDVIAMPITSQVRPVLGVGEFLIADWQAAGLFGPGVVKALVGTFDKGLIVKPLGRFGGRDLSALENALHLILGP